MEAFLKCFNFKGRVIGFRPQNRQQKLQQLSCYIILENKKRSTHHFSYNKHVSTIHFLIYYQLCPVPVDSEEKELRVIFLLTFMLIHDEPLLSGQPPLSGLLPVPIGWPLDGGLTIVFHEF